MRTRTFCIHLLQGILLSACLGTSLPALALQPADIGVVYNKASDKSIELAQHYLKARGIPQENLIVINCKAAEEISERDYRQIIVPQVKKQLEEHVAAGKELKYLVTTYDVPLKIGAWGADPATKHQINWYREELDKVSEELVKAIAIYDSIAAPPAPPPATTQHAPPANAASTTSGPATTQAATTPARPKPPHWSQLLVKLNAAATAANQRLAKLPMEERGPELLKMLNIHMKTAGLAAVLNDFGVEGQGSAAEKARLEREQLHEEQKRSEARAAELMKDYNNPQTHMELLRIRSRMHGNVGRAQQLEQFLGMLTETESCFDNELSLVLAEQGYPRGRWLPNSMNVALQPLTARRKDVPRVIPVSRIDGPSVEKAIAMIDRGIAVEKKGLQGKLYLDARGIREGGYAVLDIQMRQLAAWLKTHGEIEVILDDKPELLQAKDCPDAALYCGWYSLRNYQDSCQWVPGAVGFHVASGEMVSLHWEQENGWVVNLLKRDFCGTLGPTAEPYLTSFPDPSLFFPLLLCGEFTQGEVWTLTMPMTSWRTGYVGDPLYNPYKAQPRVKVEDVRKHEVMGRAWDILRTPSTQPATQAR